MAPADTMSPPGAARYDSNTMVVGDGTWDFTKNTFLLPNLVGLNFDTMQYNGMGNRFATMPTYHSLITAHGVMAAIVFLFVVPTSVMIARFYTSRPGRAIPYHAQLNIFGGILLTAVFILGFFAVGPPRNLTNPHHGIGVAIYTMFLLQLVGGRIVRNLGGRGRSFRLMLHQWSGRMIALLGIVQVPLGLTLYGSPRYLFILYTLWMSFLLLMYFILCYREPSNRDAYISGGRSEGRTHYTGSDHSEHDEKKKKGGIMKWLGPLAAGAGILALLRRRKDRGRSRSRSGSGSRYRSRSHGPEVIGSRRGSASYLEEEKYTDVTSRREERGGGGFMKGLLAVGAAVGAGKLIKNWRDKRQDRARDEEYSAVSTETPGRNRLRRNHGGTASEFSDMSSHHPRRDGRSSVAGDPVVAAAALSAAAPRPGTARPMTPRPSHARTGSRHSFEESDYSSYVSPSRRPENNRQSGGSAGKGILAAVGLGWLAKKMADRRSRHEEDRIRDEEDRRSGLHGSRYTGDGYASPSRRSSRRPSVRPPHSAPGTSNTHGSEMSSQVEPRPMGASHGGPPMPPLPAGGVPPPVPGPAGASTIVPVPVPIPGSHHSRSRSRSRHDIGDPAAYPPVPPVPHGASYDSGSEAYVSSGGHSRRRASARRRRAGEEAAAAAAASAGALAAEEERRRVVSVKVHDDRDRSVTLRQLTEEERRADRRRPRNDSLSSVSGTESPSARRYRRDDAAQRRAESAAERRAEATSSPMPPLSPPNPAFAAGARRQKDSAYYSGQQPGQQQTVAGPSSAQAGASAIGLGSPESHGTWSGVSPVPSVQLDKPTPSMGSTPADKRQRRRLERRRTASEARPTGADMFD